MFSVPDPPQDNMLERQVIRERQREETRDVPESRESVRPLVDIRET